MAAVALSPARPAAARRFPLVLAGTLALLLVVFILYLGTGSITVTPGDVVKVLTGGQVDDLTQIAVGHLRLPRALVAVLAGAMLALAGAILQAITRNPLAEPDLTGASAGGVFFAVLWLSRHLVGWDLDFPGIELPLVAGIGSLLAGGLVFTLSRGSGPGGIVRLVLTGVLVSTVLRSATSLILLRNQNASGSILLWIIGSLNGRTWTQWNAIWPWALVTIPFALGCAGVANALQLGDDTAASLGVRVGWARAGMLCVAVVLTAGAVASVGALGFLGLIAPHLARRVVGDDARRVFPLSTAFGALLLLTADLVARNMGGQELPVGALLALLGAPFLMYLLRRGTR
jgi:iron complex transport system permease protein